MRSLLLVIMLLPMTICAQQVNNREVWTGVGIKLKLNKNWNSRVEGQYRFDQTSGTYRYFGEVGIERELSKRWDAELSYRHTMRPDNNSRKRIMLDLSYSNKKKKDLDFGMRFRVQNSMESFAGNQRTFVRAKMGLGYNVSKLVDPYVSGEVFFKVITNNEYRGWRTTAGLDWKLSKRLDLKTFARIDREVNVREPSRVFIVGLALDYSPKFKKK